MTSNNCFPSAALSMLDDKLFNPHSYLWEKKVKTVSFLDMSEQYFDKKYYNNFMEFTQ